MTGRENLYLFIFLKGLFEPHEVSLPSLVVSVLILAIDVQLVRVRYNLCFDYFFCSKLLFISLMVKVIPYQKLDF